MGFRHLAAVSRVISVTCCEVDAAGDSISWRSVVTFAGFVGVVPLMNANTKSVTNPRHHVQTFRADHVGSFLRPRALLDSRNRFYKSGDISAAELRATEDAAIREVVKFQEDMGFKVITDGEFRRAYFHVDFLT